MLTAVADDHCNLTFCVVLGAMAEVTGPTQQIDFSVPDGEADVPVRKPWGQLVSLNPKFPNIDLLNDQHFFGRAATCDTVYPDLGISGNHARLFRERASNQTFDFLIWIEDTRYGFSLQLPDSLRY